MILPLGYRLGFGDRRADYPIGDAGAVAFSADLLRFANRRKGSETENVIARDCNLRLGKNQNENGETISEPRGGGGNEKFPAVLKDRLARARSLTGVEFVSFHFWRVSARCAGIASSRVSGSIGRPVYVALRRNTSTRACRCRDSSFWREWASWVAGEAASLGPDPDRSPGQRI